MATIASTMQLQPVEPYTGTPLPPLLPEYHIDSDVLVGIEVEVENANGRLAEVPRYWRTESDGSLRNDGVEIVSRKPIPIRYAPGALKVLIDDVLPKDCCFSPRTSIHVHLNAHDLQDERLKNLILVYALFERALFEFVGKGRKNNIYCVPLVDSELLSEVLSAQVRHIPSIWSKYTGFNLVTLANYGTVEFRHMHGCGNLEKLTIWLKMIIALYDYATIRGVSDVRSKISSLNKNSDFLAFAVEVFGDVAAFLGPKAIQMLPYTYHEVKQAFVTRSISKKTSGITLTNNCALAIACAS